MAKYALKCKHAIEGPNGSIICEEAAFRSSGEMGFCEYLYSEDKCPKYEEEKW